jgi:hypothetical protein
MFVLDYADDWGRFTLAEFLAETRRLHWRLWESSYGVTGVRGPVVIFHRSGAEGRFGTAYVSHVPPGAVRASTVPLTAGLSVCGWSLSDFVPATSGRDYGRVRAHVYLAVEATPGVDLGVGLSLVDSLRGFASVSASAIRPAGGMTASSLSWEPGRIIAESHEMAWGLAEAPDAARFKLRVDLYDLLTGQRVSSAVCE